jgi:alpha-1,3-rhamnosyl/mannosyltransferase
MLRVAFNAVALMSPLTGIGQYAKHLLQELDADEGMDVQKFYAKTWSKDVREDGEPLMGSRLKSVLKKWLPQSYDYSRCVQQRFFTSGVRKFKPDLYHEPNFLAFKFEGPSVITVHDLSWIRYPEMHPAARVRAMDKFFEPGLRRASRILTDSDFVKQELIDVFGVNPDTIHPVYLGVESDFQPRDTAQTLSTLSRHGLKHGHYLLAVGTLEPRKNLQVALRAFMTLPPAVRRRYPLVLVGMKGWHTSNLEQQLAPLIHAGEVMQLGYLDREDLTKVVAGACALIFPSVYEGFGLPLLEAMACAVPVIASNQSSIPEVVGTTGLLVDPHDVEQLAQAMLQLTQAPDIRASLAAQALERSRQFSWANCARETANVYRRTVTP